MRRRFLGNPVFDYTRYMTIESLEDGLFIQVPSAVEYTIDGTWKKLEANDSIEVHMGQFVSFKKTYVTGLNFGTFIINGRCNLRGNCMSMIFGDSGYKNNDLSGLYQPFHSMFKNCTGIVSVEPTFLPATTLADYCCDSMFDGCTSLVNAPELPATTLALLCYHLMFNGCTSLVTASELPATTLTVGCYNTMFKGCTNLTTAPELPATTLADNCYGEMFSGCTKLNYIKMLATDISASDCLTSWVYKVASSGTFVKSPAMTTLPTGTSGIPEGWTVVNDGEESGGKIVNKITFKNFYTIGPEVYAKRYCDFTPTSAVDINFYSVSGNKTGSTFVSPTNHSDGARISLGLTFDAPFTADWTPKEDDTYIYEVVLEQ